MTCREPRTALITVTPPTQEPVTLDEAKTHLRIDHDTEDKIIERWIRAAREYTESHTGKRWYTQTLRYMLEFFPPGGEIRLPVEPVSAISLFTYQDVDDVTVTLTSSDYQTWLDHSPPLISPNPFAIWPITKYAKLNAVKIEFTAGATTEVPEQVGEAIFLTLGYWDGNRGDNPAAAMDLGLPAGAKRLLDNLWSGAYR